MDARNVSGVLPEGLRVSALVGAGALLLAVLSVTLSLVLLGCADPKAEARALEEQGDMEGAVAVYQEVLRSDGGDMEALSGAAVDLFLLGRYSEALVFQERLVSLDPTDALTRIELGFNYLNHQDRPSDAARVLGEAVALEPTAKHLAFYAQAQIASGDSKGAEETLRQAVSADPTYVYAYIRLVEFLESEGRMTEAEQIVAQASAAGITIED